MLTTRRAFLRMLQAVPVVPCVPLPQAKASTSGPEFEELPAWQVTATFVAGGRTPESVHTVVAGQLAALVDRAFYASPDEPEDPNQPVVVTVVQAVVVEAFPDQSTPDVP